MRATEHRIRRRDAYNLKHVKFSYTYHTIRLLIPQWTEQSDNKMIKRSQCSEKYSFAIVAKALRNRFSDYIRQK